MGLSIKSEQMTPTRVAKVDSHSPKTNSLSGRLGRERKCERWEKRRKIGSILDLCLEWKISLLKFFSQILLPDF